MKARRFRLSTCLVRVLYLSIEELYIGVRALQNHFVVV